MGGSEARERSVPELLEGAFVPLASFCSFKKRPGVRQIERFNKQSSVSVTVSVESGSAAGEQRCSVSPADTGSAAATVDAKDATLGKTKVADAVLSASRAGNGVELASDYETSATETIRLGDIVSPDILPQSAPARQEGAADAQGDSIYFHDAHCGISD